MITRLKYNEIDFGKYSHCIEASAQRKYSAERAYLETVCGKNWEIMVFGDYEAVMPVPITTKLGRKIVVHPILCQQLGIFSSRDSVERNDLFLNFFRKNYDILYYAFNDANQFSETMHKRKNYLIYRGNYQQVCQNYSPKRKRKIQLAKHNPESRTAKNIKLSDVTGFIEKTNWVLTTRKSREYFMTVIEDFYRKNELKLYGFYVADILANLVLIHISSSTVALIGSFNDRSLVKFGGASVLVDEVLKDFVEHKTFDFEGSDLPNVEEFFRGFRPELREYCAISNSKMELAKGIITRKLKI